MRRALFSLSSGAPARLLLLLLPLLSGCSTLSYYAQAVGGQFELWRTRQPIAALLLDLKQRGLLDDTLVIWGGEFGRTAFSQGRLTATNYGRDHHPGCFTVWMAGGGVKAGLRYGETDPTGQKAEANKVHLHDLHATMLHLLGLDHERLTYRYGGRDFRLTDIHGRVVSDILA